MGLSPGLRPRHRPPQVPGVGRPRLLLPLSSPALTGSTAGGSRGHLPKKVLPELGHHTPAWRCPGGHPSSPHRRPRAASRSQCALSWN